MSSTCNDLQTSLDNFIQEGITTALSEWSEEVTTISEEVTRHVTSEAQTLKQAETTVNKYVMEDLKRDIPTGKKIYTYK